MRRNVVFSRRRTAGLLWLLIGFVLPGTVYSQDCDSASARYTFDDSDRVIGLSYYGSCGLRNAVSADVSGVGSVEIVSGTTLTEQDVSFLASLQNVTELSLGGTLSDEFVVVEGGLNRLAGLRRLEYVFLCKRDMRDDDLGFVAELPRLQHLEFPGGPNPWYEDGSAVSDACAELIARATTLRTLCIEGADGLTDQFVADISQGLHDLEHLELDSGALTDRSLQLLGNHCGHLRHLRLSSSQLTDQGVSQLAGAKKLESLWLTSPVLTAACLRSLSGWSGLRQLELTIPSIDEEGCRILAGLSELEILVLREPALSDEAFAEFRNHPALESAFLNGRDLTEAGVIQTIRTIPLLDHLDVGENEALQDSVNRFLANRRRTSGNSRTDDGK